MSEEIKDCPFCGQQATTIRNFTTDNMLCTCNNCGEYTITWIAFESLPVEIQRDPNHHKYEYSGAIRELFETGRKFPLITTENYKELLDQVVVPIKPSEKLDRLLLFINRRTNYLFEPVNISENMYSIAYAQHSNELKNLFLALEELGYFKCIHATGLHRCHLTLRGFEQAERLSEVVTTNQCFVAMWFDDPMVEVFRESIGKAVERVGYKALIIPMKEHNEDITDHIIAEIKRSRFIIADFTGLRGGVYYEAGFAAGLGKEVTMTCRDDWFNKIVEINKETTEKKTVRVKEERNVHFDVSHLNFIVWKDGADLGQRLYDRIIAPVV